MNTKTLRMTTLAVLSAIAFLLTILTKQLSFIPGYAFLRLDLKDVVITIAGFMYGPMSAMIMSLTVSLIEMLTISSTGFIGLLMNVISSCAFACTAAFFYSRKPTMQRAVIGLGLGILLATISMLLWNYIITPIYQGVPRHVIAAVLVPVFLPFNLIKYGICATLTVLLYKPIVNTLRKAHLLPAKPVSSSSGKTSTGLMIVALVLLATLVLIILSYLGVF